MLKKYVNDFIAVLVDTNKQVSYTVPTYENINSITIINKSANVYIGINNPDYLTSTYKIEPNNTLKIGGNYNEKLNAPFVLYADNIATSAPGYMYIIIKRYIN